MIRRFVVTAIAASLLAACGMPEGSEWAELSTEEQALYLEAFAGQPVVEAQAPIAGSILPGDQVVAIPDGTGAVLLVSTSSSSPGDSVSSTQDPIPTKNRRDASLRRR